MRVRDSYKLRTSIRFVIHRWAETGDLSQSAVAMTCDLTDLSHSAEVMGGDLTDLSQLTVAMGGDHSQSTIGMKVVQARTSGLAESRPVRSVHLLRPVRSLDP